MTALSSLTVLLLYMSAPTKAERMEDLRQKMSAKASCFQSCWAKHTDKKKGQYCGPGTSKRHPASKQCKACAMECDKKTKEAN